jgi:glycosyltransferase involved in cell wall biosynthesis
MGVVSDQETLAEIYSSVDVFLDGSNYQAFGRPALEAMACGAAAVLTDVGGVNEYARHEANCLLTPPGDPESFVNSILRILGDDELKQRLRLGGFETAREFCAKREARETRDYFYRILSIDRRRNTGESNMPASPAAASAGADSNL